MLNLFQHLTSFEFLFHPDKILKQVQDDSVMGKYFDVQPHKLVVTLTSPIAFIPENDGNTTSPLHRERIECSTHSVASILGEGLTRRGIYSDQEFSDQVIKVECRVRCNAPTKNEVI